MSELLFSIIVVSGIGTVLAFLLEMAFTYLGDYGERRILINNEKELTVAGGRTLLSTLSENGIFIPSACGGKGTCSYCKVKISDGGGPILPTESPYLSDTEKKAHVRLSCQVKVKQDLHIEIPEDLFLVKEYKAKVTALTDLTSEIKGISLDILLPQEGIFFKPGQYVQLEIPKYKMTKEPEYRAYSIASGSDHHNTVTLVITRALKGVVSTYVHDYLTVGEELVVRGPYGDFFLRESDNKILLVCTGSGLAPMLSIVHQIEAENRQRETQLFFGCRTKRDLYYHKELTALEHRMDHFTYIPTLSRPMEEDQWQGETGRVTDLIEKYIEENAPLDAYLCGSPKMVESCVTMLVQKGIPETRVYFDKFE